MKSKLSLALLAVLLVGGSARAESGADILMQTVKPSVEQAPKGPQVAAPNFAAVSGLQLDDPFLLQLFAQWQTEQNLPYDINAWVTKILQKDFEGAMHLWSVVAAKVPASFETPAKVARLYLLWRLKLPQSFFDAWVAHLANPAISEARTSLALEQIIAPGFDRWLVDNSITVSPEQAHIIRGLNPSRSLLYASLKGWVMLKRGSEAIAVLGLLPADHALKAPLAQTAALALARKGDLSGAARILKGHLEPALEIRKDPKALSAHYIQIARLLYQAAALDGAEQFYEKVPNGSAEYLDAREELAWVRLRKGNVAKLRGELETLSSSLFDDHFSPEVHLVRAISNLKLCFYDKVEKNIEDFITLNRKWARQIEAALNASDPLRPDAPDFYAKLAEHAIEKRTAELERLAVLGKESITAVLPAVGPQPHWVRAQAALSVALEAAKKQRAGEYRRQWKSRQLALQEAIKKMKFVRVELLSQVRQLARESGTPNVAPVASKVSAASVLKADNPDMTFPFDGVVWPDELFRLRSLAQNRCLEAYK